MPNSRKRPRTGEVDTEESKLAKEDKKIQETPTKSLAPSSSQIKTPRWRGRRRSAQTSSLSGPPRKTAGERSAKTGTASERRWAISGFHGGQFSPKSIFSRDEKYGQWKI